MTNKDYDNLEKIKRILKYLEKGRLDQKAWPNALELNESLNKLILEHNEYIEHMKHHH
tara:strand:+ start:811 stop:984 length:174 start_codon:yes stop_codon:yes gene_type:complete